METKFVLIACAAAAVIAALYWYRSGREGFRRFTFIDPFTYGIKYPWMTTGELGLFSGYPVFDHVM